MYSIRRRLMLVLAVGFTALIVSTGAYVSEVVNENVTNGFDAALLGKAQTLVQLTEDEGDIELEYMPKHWPEFERREQPEYWQFWLAEDDGSLTKLRRSSGLERADEDLPCKVSIAKEPLIWDVRLPDGRAGRIVQLAFVPRGGDGDDDDDDKKDDKKSKEAFEPVTLVLAVARGRGPLDEVLTNMHLLIYGVGGLAILFAVILVWRALAVGFRPIDSIASQVGRLDARSLSSRIQLPRTPRELAPVADQLNALLKRLEESFARERRFADNVAHELRTPIAELRSLARVGAKWPDDETSVKEFFGDVNDIAGRMEVVVHDLLLLARCHAGIEQVERAPTSLQKIIASIWLKLAPSASKSGLRFRMEVPEDVVVESDPGKLSIVLANVLGNAVSYSRPNSEIRCVGRSAGSGFQLDITNDAEPLSPSDLENVAEPFWRKDKSRSSAEHAGLGLSLVSALAKLLRLRVQFDQDRDGTFRVGLAGWAVGGSTLDPDVAMT